MRLNQVTLAVTDFEESVAFYQRLGLKLIVSERGEYARFVMPQGESTLSLHLAHKAAGGQTMIYFETDEIDALYESLSAAGVAFENPPQNMPWLWREARFFDPSGNALCLFHAGGNRRNPPWRLVE